MNHRLYVQVWPIYCVSLQLSTYGGPEVQNTGKQKTQAKYKARLKRKHNAMHTMK